MHCKKPFFECVEYYANYIFEFYIFIVMHIFNTGHTKNEVSKRALVTDDAYKNPEFIPSIKKNINILKCFVELCKQIVDQEEQRRVAIESKCKGLLTISSLLFGGIFYILKQEIVQNFFFYLALYFIVQSILLVIFCFGKRGYGKVNSSFVNFFTTEPHMLFGVGTQMIEAANVSSKVNSFNVGVYIAASRSLLFCVFSLIVYLITSKT